MFKRLVNITICLVMVLGSLSIVGGEQKVMAEVAYLDDIAGISAYAQVTSGTDFMTLAKSACSTIPELEVVEIINDLPITQYFICSVNIEGYADVYSPHVFVHSDGWIMAYYLKNDPAAKMIDVIAQPLVDPLLPDLPFPTLLEKAVVTVSTAVTTEIPTVSLYDFSNPLATDMLFVAEDKAEDLGELGDNDAWFTIALPTGSYSEISYAFYQNYYPSFAKDGANFVTANAEYIGPVPTGTIYGELSPGDFITDESYLFEVDTFSLAEAGYGALLITHSEVVDPFVIESADWVEEYTLEPPSTDLTDLFTFDFAPGSFLKFSDVYDLAYPTVATLTWEVSSGATNYEYCIDEGDDAVCDTGWVSTGTATSVTLTGLPFNAIYYWQVRAVNGYETTEADGGWFTFSTKTGPPDAFLKFSPVDGDIGIATSPILDWGDADGAEYYEYCVIESDAACEIEDWVNTGLVSQVIVNLEVGTEYTWQVRAGNSVGSTYADDEFFSFTTIQNTFPKISPFDETLGVNPKATLMWGDMLEANEYQYCITTNPNSCSRWISTGEMTEATLKGLKYNTVYYWQVRAVMDTGTTEADNGVWWSFTTRDRKAPVKATPDFEKISPVDNLEEVQVDNLVLDWQDVAKVTSYEYCFDTTNDGACIKWVKVDASEVTIPELSYETTYFWQVRATVAGIVGYADSGYWSFTTIDEPIIEPEPIP